MTITAPGTLSPDPGTVPVFPLSMFDPVRLGVEESGEQIRVNLAERMPLPRRAGRSSSPFGSGETAGTRALLILSGLVSVAFGVLLFARRRRRHPGPAIRLYSLIYGFSQITAGIQVRHLGGDVRSLTELRNAG